MHYEHHRYVGKVCVVTGAANGLGLNLVNRLVEEGALVGALDLEQDTLDKEFGDKTVYFGPMGCRTGFYLLLAGDYESKDILPLVVEMYGFVRDFEGEVPGASPKDCGNYLDMNLGMAKYLAVKYLKVLTHIDEFPESRLVYPE